MFTGVFFHLIFIALVNMFFNYVEEKHGQLYVSAVLATITTSKYGLGENELLDILSCNQQVRILINRLLCKP